MSIADNFLHGGVRWGKMGITKKSTKTKGSTARDTRGAGVAVWSRDEAPGQRPARARPAPGQSPDRARDRARVRIRRPTIQKEKTMKTHLLKAGASYSKAGSVPGSVRALSGLCPGVRFLSFFTAILLFVFGIFPRRFFCSFSEFFHCDFFFVFGTF